jgi:AAA15 family ATPase/GTPase
MLLEFGARNFYSFKEGFNVSFGNKNETITVLGIKGANASGKTNVIRALSYIRDFMMSSFSLFQPDQGTFVKSFFDIDSPTDFFIHFMVNNMEYKYELELTQEKVLNETFSRKDKRWIQILVREESSITECTSELNELKNINLNRSNASIISISYQYGLEELDIFYKFAQNITTNVGFLGKHTNDEHFLGYQDISKRYFNDKDMLNVVAQVLNKADTGIEKIEIVEYTDEKTKVIRYEPLFHHLANSKVQKLFYQDESTGVKVLYRQLGVYLTALRLGAVVAFDEFDTNIHPDLLPMIIDLFEDKIKNKNQAQLIFTSHHTEVIDQLGKYRVVFVNKEENESYLYRLDEISGEILRPDRSILPAYNSYKIGGRPKVMNA